MQSRIRPFPRHPPNRFTHRPRREIEPAEDIRGNHL
jgi:hypothetical protein